jgi:hypothetical protein
MKLVLLTGEQIVVKPDEVKKRVDAKNSIMPASFSNTLERAGCGRHLGLDYEFEVN